MGACCALALTAASLELLDQARQRLRDKRLKALQQIECTQHANERCERGPATALQPLHGRQRHPCLGGKRPLGHVSIQSKLREAAAKVRQDRAVTQLLSQLHNASF